MRPRYPLYMLGSVWVGLGYHQWYYAIIATTVMFVCLVAIVFFGGYCFYRYSHDKEPGD